MEAPPEWLQTFLDRLAANDLSAATRRGYRYDLLQFIATLTGGMVMVTAGIAALPETVCAGVMARVITFEDFSADNDPHGEHDLGTFDYQGRRIMWKIDYYDAAMEFGSENPADPSQTTRVLTIMLASGY